MGFAVAADEVCNLSQRCAQAARDTSALIEESIAKSNDGKLKVDQVAKAITPMEQVTQQTANSAEESAAAAEELNAQSETLKEIVERLAIMVGGAEAARGQGRP
jgi:methyl-accepting chemotaxis protein